MMYRALYRKWRPQRFEDVIGQAPIVAALQNQIAADRIGHAYLFTGTRGTGKTTCAKIFAKAVNCTDTSSPDPCCQCAVCKGIDNGSITDVVEMDAASNRGIDDIRDMIKDASFLPSVCRYKVYILDEVHMLSKDAWNAFLKLLEEPPSHVIFILATTEVNKVLPTVLSRCQRYDFARITAEDIAKRLNYVAEQENIALTLGAAALIGRLADGAMRDALSILDTCAGVGGEVDEALVRRMAGVTDRTYLFEISDAIARSNAVAALQKIAELRQQSVDMRRLCMELAGHYRNLMLCGMAGGVQLLTGTSPEEEAAYEARKDFPQREAIRAINEFGEALNKMGRGTDQRIELELAIFALTRSEIAVQPVQIIQASVPQPTPQVMPFATASVSPANEVPTFVPPAATTPNMYSDPVQAKTDFVQPFAEATPIAAQSPRKVAPVQKAPEPFVQWPMVLAEIESNDAMLASYLRNSKAYYDGVRVLIECSDAFRDYMRSSKSTAKSIKEYIFRMTGIKCGIGPYTPANTKAETGGISIDETIQNMRANGVDVVIQDK